MHYVETPVRVLYADTDQAGIVYYGTYPTYFEIGRSEYMRAQGFTYKEFEHTGHHLVVVGMEVRYHSTATYDDLLAIRTSIAELKSRGLTFRYEVYRDGSLVVDGTTRHVCINRNKKSVSIPVRLTEALRHATP
jgi:acyl-CoA thioester hydrolase